MKKTAVAPSNIAFTKYWGKKNEHLRIPENGSISMTLSNLLTTTTVEFSEKYKKDEVALNSGVHLAGAEDSSPPRWPTRPAKPWRSGDGLLGGGNSRAIQHLDRIREMAKITMKAKVVSKNNFPIATGLSSSASGFAALTLAASNAAGLSLSEKELSMLARQGSGSACRSIPSGFVEWLDGDRNETSYAVQIFPPSYWNIADVVVIVNEGKKEVATTQAQKSAASSPFMRVRLSHMKEKNKKLKELIRHHDFQGFGEFIEQEALELHAIMLTQTPPLIYWLPATVLLIRLVGKWRREGLPVYFTVNTGQNIHLICEQKNVGEVQEKLKAVKDVKGVIINSPGQGTRLTEDHLF